MQRGGELRPLAGGTRLVVDAAEGRAERGGFFDLSLVPELRGIEEREDALWIGALSTHTEIAALLPRIASGTCGSSTPSIANVARVAI